MIISGLIKAMWKSAHCSSKSIRVPRYTVDMYIKQLIINGPEPMKARNGVSSVSSRPDLCFTLSVVMLCGMSCYIGLWSIENRLYIEVDNCNLVNDFFLQGPRTKRCHQSQQRTTQCLSGDGSCEFENVWFLTSTHTHTRIDTSTKVVIVRVNLVLVLLLR